MKRPPVSMRAKALALLSGREYSRAELARKLGTHARKREAVALGDESPGSTIPAEIEALLDEFTLKGWLSEERYVEQSVNRLSRRYGTRRVMQNLQSKGIKTESVQASKPYLESVALATAKALLDRKYRAAAVSKEDRSKRVRFLQGRGFDYDVIRKALRDSGSEDEV